jgi:hypothetical protein
MTVTSGLFQNPVMALKDGNCIEKWEVRRLEAKNRIKSNS